MHNNWTEINWNVFLSNAFIGLSIFHLYFTNNLKWNLLEMIEFHFNATKPSDKDKDCDVQVWTSTKFISIVIYPTKWKSGPIDNCKWARCEEILSYSYERNISEILSFSIEHEKTEWNDKNQLNSIIKTSKSVNSKVNKWK